MLVRNDQLPPAIADLRTAVLVDDPSSWVRSELLALDLPLPRGVTASVRQRGARRARIGWKVARAVVAGAGPQAAPARAHRPAGEDRSTGGSSDR